jgi:hypothetical protein
MRLSELCGSEVRDGHDRPIGQVVDVRVVHELANADEGPRPFRITGILVASRRQGRIGRPDQRGPLLFRLFDRRAEQRRRFVPWGQVESARPGVVRVRLTPS